MGSTERLGRMIGLLVLVATLSAASAGGGLVHSLPGSDVTKPFDPADPARVTSLVAPPLGLPDQELSQPEPLFERTDQSLARGQGSEGPQVTGCEAGNDQVRLITHVIAAGENLTTIAGTYGVAVATVAQSNGISNPNRIYPGQTLVFPSIDGVVHLIRSGESLTLIARLYQVDPEPIITANELADPNILPVGATLIIPGGSIPPPPQSSSSTASVSSSTGTASAARLIWPLRGTITSRYGPRWGGFHTGVDIASSYGATIRAAAAGRVVFADWYGRYGRTVIIDHGGGLSTLYSHAATLLVSKGQSVSQGQAVATVGSSGNSTGPHLHFEVRLNGQTRNPLSYLKD